MPRASEIGLAFAAIGAAFLVISYPLGLLSFQTCWDAAGRLAGVVDCPLETVLRKEVGFFAAPNWPFVQMFIFPPFLYFVFHTVQVSRELLPELRDRDMLVTDRFRTLRVSELGPLLRRRVIWGVVFASFLAVLVTITLFSDFTRVVSAYYDNPNLVGGIDFEDDEAEVDWSIAAPACRHFGVTASPCDQLADGLWFEANRVFAAFAYMFMPWAGSIVMCGFMVCMFLFATIPLGSDFRHNNKLVVPDLHSPWPRRGFEVFEELFIHAIGAAVMAFVFGYLVALQNVHLRSNSASFVTEVMFGLGWPPHFVANANTIAVGALAILLLAAVVLSMFASRLVALRGRDAVLTAIKQDNEDVKKLFGTGLKALRPEQVQQMLTQDFAYWPVPWISFATVLICLGVGLVSLFLVSYGFVVVAAGVAVVLGLAVLRKWRERPVRILMAVSSPPDQEPLDLLPEVRAVQDELNGASRGKALLQPAPAAKWQDLVDDLKSFKPTILHFSGHGSKNGIVLDGDKGGERHVSAEELRALLTQSPVRLVVLNCCYSDAYADVVVEAVDTVVGVVGSPYDPAARQFSAVFYRSLAGGANVDQAVRAAGKAANEISEQLGDEPHQFDATGNINLVLADRGWRRRGGYFGVGFSASRA